MTQNANDSKPAGSTEHQKPITVTGFEGNNPDSHTNTDKKNVSQDEKRHEMDASKHPIDAEKTDSDMKGKQEYELPATEHKHQQENPSSSLDREKRSKNAPELTPDIFKNDTQGNMPGNTTSADRKDTGNNAGNQNNKK